MISTDRKIFDEKSVVHARMAEYGTLARRLDIIVFTTGASGFSDIEIAPNTFAHPTNSRSRWRYISDALRLGKKIMAEDRIDLVTAQDPFETGLVGRRLTKHTTTRLQLQIHTDIFNQHFIHRSLINKIRVRMARSLIPQADCVRVVGAHISDSLATAGVSCKKPIQVLPIFVDREQFRNTDGEAVRARFPQFDRIVLMVSRLESEKNISLALRVFKRVLAEYPKAGLVIVGEGSDRDILEKKADRDGLRGHVVLEGSHDDIAPYYAGADVFLHTSNYEGYGMVLVEAALSSCPIVSTSVGITRWFEDGESAMICPVGDEACMAEKLEQVLGNDTLRRQIALRGQNVVEKNITEKTKADYLAAYKKTWEECL